MKQFVRSFRGYDRPQVDEFMLRLSEELDRLLRENAQHEERLRSAQEQLRVYRDRERAMDEALISAQQLRTETRDQAERAAEQLLREARTEAERIVGRARQDEQMVRDLVNETASRLTEAWRTKR